MTIKFQKLLSGLIGSMLSRKAAYPAKNGVSRMRSRSLLWAIGFERFNQRLQKRNVFVIRCSQSCLRNRSCSLTKLPSEQELQFNAPAGTSPVTILLPGNIRIEIGADCPARLMTALLQALKNYA